MKTSMCMALAILATGCGTTKMYRADWTPIHEDEREVTDEEIARLLKSAPQLPAEVTIAVYGADAEKALGLEAALANLPAVAKTVTLSPFLLNGSARFPEEPGPVNLFHANEELSMRKLRLLAAKARCDALVVIDYAYRRRTKANGLAALNILLVPALFTPFMDVEIASYLDAYVFDVRNDYFYGQVSATEEDIRSFSTIYATEQAKLIDEQWTRMVAKVGEELSRLM